MPVEDLLSCYAGRPSCLAGDLLGEVRYLLAAAREVRAFLWDWWTVSEQLGHSLMEEGGE